MRFRKWHGLAVLFLGSLLSIGQATATTVTWSTYTSWNSNVTGGTELNFNAVSNSGTYSTAAGKTLVPLSGPAVPFVFTGPYTGGYQLTGYEYTSRQIISLAGPTGGNGTITITLPSGGENAILLGLGTVGSAPSLTIVLSDGESFNVAATAGSTEFLGLSISHDINSLTISSSSQAVLDDFYFGASKLAQDGNPPVGQTPVVAEGSTLSLLGGGLLIFFAFRRKLFPQAFPDARG